MMVSVIFLELRKLQKKMSFQAATTDDTEDYWEEMMLAEWGEEGLRRKLKYSALYVPPQAVVWGFRASCMGPAQKHHYN